MSRQTAVEWFFQQIYSRQFNPTTYRMTERQLLKMFLQAKTMEKEQIEDAYQLGFEDGDSNVSIYFDKKEYYNQTYGGDK